MAALTTRKAIRRVKFSRIDLAATASVTYFEGGIACFNTATGLVAKPSALTTLIPIGWFGEDKTLGAGGGSVNVILFKEVHAIWCVNDPGADNILATDVGGLAYLVDDQMVKRDDDTNTLSVLGRIWKRTAGAVLVEPLATAGDATLSGLD